MGESDPAYVDDLDPLSELEGPDGRIRVDTGAVVDVEGSMSEVTEVGGVQQQAVQPQQEGEQVMAKAEKAEKVKKTPVGLTEDVAKQVRQYQAKLILATGDKVSASDAIGAALKIALK